MNATEQAITIELAQKIACTVSVFREFFLDAEPDLSPWISKGTGKPHINPDSIDFSLHFPGVHPTCCCQCILVELYFSGLPHEPETHLQDIEMHGFYEKRLCWHFSTHHQWDFIGQYRPGTDAQRKLIQYVEALMIIFPHHLYKKSSY